MLEIANTFCYIATSVLLENILRLLVKYYFHHENKILILILASHYRNLLVYQAIRLLPVTGLGLALGMRYG